MTIWRQQQGGNGARSGAVTLDAAAALVRTHVVTPSKATSGTPSPRADDAAGGEGAVAYLDIYGETNTVASTAVGKIATMESVTLSEASTVSPHG
ncbi:hypothetical protein E2562_004138 [Oryza meyeriana var. granulata]|uniref:Uncharacterized protein n=1 Tax=Oryza meyeriana var. granulata TaxID=110450 RepID=A0A6G1EV54_9ORYZ|nr:hypothetical protein E2562_004138 [Oryza meyeriana var. granulata]